MSLSFADGAGYVLTGLRWLPRAGLRGFVAVPLLINTVLFSIGIWFGVNQLQRLDQALLNWLPTWLDWLHWLLWPLFILTALVVVFYSFTLVANLIGSPFNSLLADRVEKILAAQSATPRPSAATTWRDFLAIPFTELRRLLYFAGWAIPLLIVSFVPAINAAAPVLWAGFISWMLALQYADYPLGNRGLKFREQRQLLRRHWPLALGFGGMTLLLTSIPIVNFLAMPAAVIGATLLWNQELADPR
ncbi:MAG: sulfate transporter CysZ [Candidatus Competibacteraceae bacterium]|nr:sulfate transporter CysZ [Candidatus Competibacteraceae bacterium]MBK8964544.1 sulfate transporter CysZ [Candidatus Competibacteraceae bacterium]MBK9952539.1 sulfate transporter CysZ [Candidatus Competibacteraceae bacterium]